MNFKVFGGLFMGVGAILALIGFPQVFPDFGKSAEQIQAENYADALTLDPEEINALNCIFDGVNCDSDSDSSASEAFPVGPTLLWVGVALLVLGLMFLVSAKSTPKSE